MSAPQGKEIGPVGLEPPTGARNRRKATVNENTKKPATSDPSFDPGFLLLNIRN